MAPRTLRICVGLGARSTLYHGSPGAGVSAVVRGGWNSLCLLVSNHATIQSCGYVRLRPPVVPPGFGGQTGHMSPMKAVTGERREMCR